MSLQKQDQMKQALLEVTLKALKDEAYKKRLEETPAKAIKELYPDFNTDAEIVVQDQTAQDTLYINVSPFTVAALYEGIEELELSEEALEMVSGGVASDWQAVCNNKVNWDGCKPTS